MARFMEYRDALERRLRELGAWPYSRIEQPLRVAALRALRDIGWSDAEVYDYQAWMEGDEVVAEVKILDREAGRIHYYEVWPETGYYFYDAFVRREDMSGLEDAICAQVDVDCDVLDVCELSADVHEEYTGSVRVYVDAECPWGHEEWVLDGEVGADFSYAEVEYAGSEEVSIG